MSNLDFNKWALQPLDVRYIRTSVAARKDDAPAAGQAAMTKVAGSMAFSGGGGLIQTTSGRCQQRVLPLQRRG